MNTMDQPQLHIVTYNIHKGFSQFHRHLMVHELREQLRELGPDIVFLQEVQGRNSKHAKKFEDWPGAAQHEFLAEDVWQSTAYGGNVMYGHGHHGNPILARIWFCRWKTKVRASTRKGSTRFSTPFTALGVSDVDSAFQQHWKFCAATEGSSRWFPGGRALGQGFVLCSPCRWHDCFTVN